MLSLVLFSSVWLAWAQQTPPPGCKPLTYFGVHGCELSDHADCPKGYHKQAACPSNPLMKAPCRLLCVADGRSKKDKEKGKDQDDGKAAHGCRKPR